MRIVIFFQGKKSREKHLTKKVNIVRPNKWVDFFHFEFTRVIISRCFEKFHLGWFWALAKVDLPPDNNATRPPWYLRSSWFRMDQVPSGPSGCWRACWACRRTWPPAARTWQTRCLRWLPAPTRYTCRLRKRPINQNGSLSEALNYIDNMNLNLCLYLTAFSCIASSACMGMLYVFPSKQTSASMCCQVNLICPEPSDSVVLAHVPLAILAMGCNFIGALIWIFLFYFFF